MPVKFKDLFRSRGSRSQSPLPTSSPSSQAAAPPGLPAQLWQTTISASSTAINTHDSLVPIGEGQNHGVRVLYDSGIEASVDIVFVHGLTGNAYNTWLHKDTRVHWPSQLLRQDIPDARILSFGYDADRQSMVLSTQQRRSNRLRRRMARAQRANNAKLNYDQMVSKRKRKVKRI